MAPPNLKKMIQVKIKPRQDSYTDQFSRIFMRKMLMLTAAVTGISWMKDKVTCIVPKQHDADGGFISRSCWINGFYIFKDLKPSDMSYYYGIPLDIRHDGINQYGSLCSTKTQHGTPIAGCTPLKKTFFLQYQWFPLAIAAIGFLYYLPYMLFRVVNADLQDIKVMIKGKNADNVDGDAIVKKFFLRKNNSVSHLQARVLLNVIVKILYIISNVVGMMFVNSTINNDFMDYGTNWSAWTELEHQDMYDYTNPDHEKAGHQLLPGFGLCQVFTSAKDIKVEVKNVHTYICELSQHILYQYILIILWYMFIFGILIAICGLIQHIVMQTLSALSISNQGDRVKRVYKKLSVREKQYLDFIRNKNLPVFTKILGKVADIDKPRSWSESENSTVTPISPEKESMMVQ